MRRTRRPGGGQGLSAERMRVAFYAPLKPPDHPVPSGDRRMARLLMAALTQAGHDVELASRLRAYDRAGDPARQARLRDLGARLARRLLRRYAARPPERRPAAWLTYHLYYKAPDWIGPHVAAALGIPYLVAEASLANKRAGGPWNAGHRATLEALAQAAAVVAVNPADVPALPPATKLLRLPPFLDPGPYRAAAAHRATHRAALARDQSLDPEIPWLLCVAMMRPGDKLASYQVLAEALGRLVGREWRLLLVGDGPARAAVEAAFAWAPAARLRWLGEIGEAALPDLYAACDLMLWPAINEAYGMALLEAQASGLPVVAGAAGGVPALVADGETGALVPPGDAAAFAAAAERLLDAPEERQRLGVRAAAKVAHDHGLTAAARALDGLLREIGAGA